MGRVETARTVQNFVHMSVPVPGQLETALHNAAMRMANTGDSRHGKVLQASAASSFGSSLILLPDLANGISSTQLTSEHTPPAKAPDKIPVCSCSQVSRRSRGPPIRRNHVRQPGATYPPSRIITCSRACTSPSAASTADPPDALPCLHRPANLGSGSGIL